MNQARQNHWNEIRESAIIIIREFGLSSRDTPFSVVHHFKARDKNKTP